MSGLLLLAVCLLPVTCIVSAAMLLPDASDVWFRSFSVALACAYVGVAGPVLVRLTRRLFAQIRGIRHLHPKRRETLQDVVVLAPPTAPVIVAPGSEPWQMLVETSALGLCVILALVLYNELEMRGWARLAFWRAGG